MKAQKNQYERELKVRDVKWAGDRNVWAMKLDRYDTEMSEAVQEYSRKVGKIQSNFGLTKDAYHKQNEQAYSNLVKSSKVNEGGRSTAYGRNVALAHMYGEGARKANLDRAGVQQYGMLRATSRQLLGSQNQALTKRGLAPIPGVAPAKPVFPGPLETLANNAMMAAQIVGGVQGIGTAAGLSGAFQPGTGLYKFFGGA